MKKNVTHLGIYGIAQKAGKILLIEKIRGPYVGKLDLPGGKLEHGETIDECLKREFAEETGLKIGEAIIFDNYTHNVDFDFEGDAISMHHIGLIYLISDFDDSKLLTNIEKEDSGGARWVNIEDLQDDRLSPFANLAIKKIRKGVSKSGE